MSKFRCRCGYVMVFQTGEESYDLALIPDTRIGDAAVAFEKRSPENVDEFLKILDSERLKVMRCPQCDRLWVENEVRGGLFYPYQKEKE